MATVKSLMQTSSSQVCRQRDRGFTPVITRMHTQKSVYAQRKPGCSMGMMDDHASAGSVRVNGVNKKRAMTYKLALRELVEAEWGTANQTPSVSPEDPLLAELYKRAEEMEANSAHLRRILAARRGVETCFNSISVALTQDLDKLSVKQLLSNATQDIRTLIDVHSNEGKPLVEEHLTHVACETEPIVMGRYLLRMPPMVGGGSIAVPHLFLAQIYSASIAFGYALGKAEQQQSLEEALGPHSYLNNGTAAASLLRKLEQDHPDANSLVSFLYSEGVRDKKSSAMTISNETAHAVAQKHTQRLFGTKDALLAQVDHIMLLVASPEEAQESLDQAMRNGTIPWLRLSATGLRRLMLEAVAFGLFLWDAELLMDVELHHGR